MTYREQRRFRPFGALLLAVALALLAQSASAATTSEIEPGWKIRFYAASIDFDPTHTDS